jgi:hypothetical protein
MGRKSIETTADLSPQPVLEVAPEYVEAVNTMALIDAAQRDYSQGRDLVNQLLGQAQMAAAIGKMTQTFGVSKLVAVKEGKLYQSLKGVKTPNGLELEGTWEEFCNLLGISDEKANQDIANLQAFGEEALEQMQRIGVGYRDLRKFRKLPEDQRVSLIEAAKEGDKGALLEFAEDLIAKHAKEKDSLTKERDSARARLADETETNERIILSKNEKIDKLDRELHRLQRSIELPSWPDQVPELNIQSMSLIGQVQILLSRLEAQREAIMAVDFGDRAGEPEAVSAMESMAMTYVRGLEDCFNQLADLAHAGRTVFDLWPTGEDGEGELLFFGNAAAQDDEQEGI